jgi:hypothetical protein
MRRGINPAGETGSHCNSSRSKVFRESFGTIQAISGGAPGPHDGDLREVRVPAFPLYIKDDGRIVYLSQKTGIFRMQDIEDSYAERLRFVPLLFGALSGARRKQILRDFGWNSLRFQFFAARVQYRSRTPKITKKGVGSSKAEASYKGHPQHRMRATVAVHRRFHGPD